MIFHVIGIPTTKNSKESLGCAFTQNCINFCKMMYEDGHKVYFYGTEGKDVLCHKSHCLMSLYEQKMWLDKSDINNDFNYDEVGRYPYDPNLGLYKNFNERLINCLGNNVGKDDFVISFLGGMLYPLYCYLDKKKCVYVEAAIGYGGVIAENRVFCSYSHQMHIETMKAVRIWDDKQKSDNEKYGADFYSETSVVIPHYLDVNDFEYSNEKKDYMLCIGRTHHCKGIDIAIKATKIANKKLIVAGMGGSLQKNYPSLKEDDMRHVEYIGFANLEKRKELMRDAKAVFCLSRYKEPFGMVMIEAFMSGTPVITLDHASFVENNIDGVTGYRCRTFEDVVNACINVEKLDYGKIRDHGLTYSLENIKPKYIKYFNHLLKWRNGEVQRII